VTQSSWEPKLKAWSVGPGPTEEAKMEHAVSAIRTAIDRSPGLASHDIEVLGTGSFKNRTHIPTESDVDVAVIYRDVFSNDWSLVDPRASTDTAVAHALMTEAGISPATYRYAEYKNDVEAALVAHFGRSGVRRGDKAFDIRENTYRVESDCIAMFEHRRWMRDGRGRLTFVTGTKFSPDSEPNRDVRNWPKQQFKNGGDKHTRTGRRYKKQVRILKNLANAMRDAGIVAAAPIPSFLIECLVYCAPDGYFGQPTFYEELDDVLAYLVVNTRADDLCSEWTEVNEIKRLFHSGQPWTRQQVFDFTMEARDFVGFG
jgi:hypothetical protein